MVGPLLLLKMLHCRRMKGSLQGTKDESAVEGTSQDVSLKEFKIMKRENDDNVCRVCLKEGILPIYGDDDAEDISEALNTFGGINVQIEDPYPKFICGTCNSLLQGAILFRKTAQKSDEILNKQHSDDLKHSISLQQQNIEPRTENRLEVLVDDNDDSMEFSEEDHVPLSSKKRKALKNNVHHCKKCNIYFETFKELDEHRMSEKHENMRHVCPYCHKSYAPMYYKKHLTLHTQAASYVCDVCGKNFIMQGHFQRHRLTHFYKLPFQCSLCPYKGRFRESLKMHMRSHTGEKPYQCTECPGRFINKSNLNKHMLTHKGEPDFKCDSCGRKFYTKRDVDLHYKVDHAGVKDHVCKVCGKAFGYRKQMMKHELKVHKRAKLRSGRTPLYLKVESMQQQGQDIVTES